MPEPRPTEELVRFLTDAFSSEELEGLSGELGIRELLPAAAPLTDMAFELVHILERRGELDDAFFRTLSRHRPRRATEISALQSERVSRLTRHVVVAYAREDAGRAGVIVRQLDRRGVNVWFDEREVLPGQHLGMLQAAAIEGASAIVVLVTASSASLPGVADQIFSAQSQGIPVIPVLDQAVGWGSIPSFLRAFKYVELDGLRSLDRLADTLLGLGRLPAPEEAPSIQSVALAFLRAAGRQPHAESAVTLRTPEPVVLARGSPAKPLDVAPLEGIVAPGDLAYFLHEGPLPDSVVQRLGELRLRGNPVVTIAAESMRAALQDGNARAVMMEHTRLGTAGVNLFDASNAVINPSLFFGRTDLLNHVGGSLGHGDAVLVSGVRKAGKSSFLHIVRQGWSELPAAWIDLQKLDRADPVWPDRAFASIVAAWDRWSVEKRGTTRGNDAPPGKVDKACFIEEMEARSTSERAEGRTPGMLVVLDELERVLPTDAVEAGRFELFSGALRALSQGAERCLTVLAADLRPEANRRNLLPNGHTNPWFQFFVEVPLPPLNLDEIEQMVRTLAAQMGVANVEDRLAEEIVAITGGHAFLARITAAAAWEEREQKDRLQRGDLSRGLSTLEKAGRLTAFYRENLWAPLDAEERGALRQLVMNPWVRHLPQSWQRIFGPKLLKNEVIASLRNQGLVNDTGIMIAGFERWIRDVGVEPGVGTQQATV